MGVIASASVWLWTAVLLLWVAMTGASHYRQPWQTKNAVITNCSDEGVNLNFLHSSINEGSGRVVAWCLAGDNGGVLMYTTFDADTGKVLCSSNNVSSLETSRSDSPPIIFTGSVAKGELVFTNVAECKELLVAKIPPAKSVINPNIVAFASGRISFAVLLQGPEETSVELIIADLTMDAKSVVRLKTQMQSLDNTFAPVFFDSLRSSSLQPHACVVTSTYSINILVGNGTILWSTPSFANEFWTADVGGAIVVLNSDTNTLFCVPFEENPSVKNVSLGNASQIAPVECTAPSISDEDGLFQDIVCNVMLNASFVREYVVIDTESCAVRKPIPISPVHSLSDRFWIQGQAEARALVVETYVLHEYAFVMVIDIRDPTERWLTRISQPNPATSSNHTILVVSDQPGQSICAYDLRTRRRVVCVPFQVTNAVFLVAGDMSLYAVDPFSGILHKVELFQSFSTSGSVSGTLSTSVGPSNTPTGTGSSTAPLTSSRSFSSSESLSCWGANEPNECAAAGARCVQNSLTGGCVPAANASISCPDLSGPLLETYCVPVFTPRCQNCGASWGICRSPEFSCPSVCSALQTEEECGFAKKRCRWVGSFCSSNECFTFLEPNYTVLPLVLYLMSCVKASIVILLSSLFGRYFGRMWLSRSFRAKKQVPLVVIDQAPMLEKDSPLRALVYNVSWFEKYVEHLLRERFRVAQPSQEDVNLAAYYLVKTNSFFTLNDVSTGLREQMSTTPSLERNGSEGSSLNKDNFIQMLQMPQEGRHTVYYIPSLSISRRIQGAVDVFPGTLWLVLYNLGAFIVLVVGTIESIHVRESNGDSNGPGSLSITSFTAFQLVAFRFMNSSLPVTAALVLAKYIRAAMFSRKYFKGDSVVAGWTMTKRITAIRHEEDVTVHALSATYLLQFLPFLWVSGYGSALYTYISLPLIAGALLIPFVCHRFLIPWIERLGQHSEGEEEHLLKTVSEYDSLHSSTDQSTDCFKHLVSEDGLSTRFHDVQVQEGDDAKRPSSSVLSRRRYSRVLSAMLSFLTFDVVWAAVFGALLQMSLNYALMKLNATTFGLHNDEIPSTEWSARSYGCLEYIVKYDADNLVSNLRRKIQVVVALVPFA